MRVLELIAQRVNRRTIGQRLAELRGEKAQCVRRGRGLLAEAHERARQRLHHALLFQVTAEVLQSEKRTGKGATSRLMSAMRGLLKGPLAIGRSSRLGDSQLATMSV